jgi:hypothetical protein
MKYYLFTLFLALSMVSCDNDQKLDKVKSDMEDPKGNFVLYVSNQSFDIPIVDIEISIDGKPVLKDYFDVEDQHNWIKYKFRLSDGIHNISAVSHIKSKASFNIELNIINNKWAVLEFVTKKESKRVPLW